jgi:hypothetical protein
VVGAMPRRAVVVAVCALGSRQESIEGGHHVVVRARPDLDDDKPCGRMRDEDRKETVAAIGSLGDERGAGGRQFEQPAAAPRPDGELARLYGKMLRIASRIRPSPPPTGADS